MKKTLIIHPLMFAVSPVLFGFGATMKEFYPNVVLMPMVLAACLAFMAWTLLSLLLRDSKKAGLVVSLLFLLLFSYESTYDCIGDFAVGLGVSRAWTRDYLRACLLAGWAVVFALGTYLLIRAGRDLRNLTNVANVMASALVAISVINIGAYELRTRLLWREADSAVSAEPSPAELTEPDMLPDIYYIILDGYPRADILDEMYQYDNTEFLDHLTSKGFYVAGKSRSNYCQTGLSLASSLNLQYLNDPPSRRGLESGRLGPAHYMIMNNRVSRFLENYGYRTVAFASGWYITEMKSADIYMAPRWSLDPFQVQLLEMTPIPFVMNQLGRQDRYGLHRERILYAFDHLADVRDLPGPTFVLAHIMAPHPPFVFGPHGEEVDPDYKFTIRDGSHLIRKRRLTRDEYVQGYRDQLVFVNSRVRTAVDRILSESGRPAIIILQADHGPGSMLDWEDPQNTDFRERLSILNAYYLPNNGDTNLYDGITPVNTFRVIFNHYFGTDYELLSDESYFSTFSQPYDFIDVTDAMDASARAEGPG